MNEYKQAPPKGDERWAQDLIGRVAFAALVEQRRARRWGIFFKSLFFIYLLAIAAMIYFPVDWSDKGADERHTALISIDGLIADATKANADTIISGLRAAFKDDKTAGVILKINSPGGSPVQSGQIYDEIIRLRQANPKIPVYAVAQDVCASGGYYIAAAAQHIYADKASIIGSIGVRADGFGFVGTMEKLGMERRLYTAGENKALLDPFLPQQEEDVRYLQALLGEVHQQFINAVRNGRGERLRETPGLFSGLIWTGEKGVELGLIDGLGSARYVAEELIGAKEMVDFTPKTRMIDQLFEQVQLGLDRLLERALGINSPLS